MRKKGFEELFTKQKYLRALVTQCLYRHKQIDLHRSCCSRFFRFSLLFSHIAMMNGGKIDRDAIRPPLGSTRRWEIYMKHENKPESICFDDFDHSLSSKLILMDENVLCHSYLILNRKAIKVFHSMLRNSIKKLALHFALMKRRHATRRRQEAARKTFWKLEELSDCRLPEAWVKLSSRNWST